MTESEWFDETDPDEMLRFLRGRADARRLRLFAIACCRCIESFHKLDPIAWQGVTTSERYADGEASDEELEAAFLAADRAHSRGPQTGGFHEWQVLDAARLAAHPEIRGLADGTACAAAMAMAPLDDSFWAAYARERNHQCQLLRDIFGNPFRPARPRTAELTSQAISLARSIYADRAFELLPRLAALLAAAGCAEQDVVAHCRQGGEHVRGCWALDWILGRN